jgi:hypothetical protein
MSKIPLSGSSSLSSPINGSQYPFFHGLPGSINSGSPVCVGVEDGKCVLRLDLDVVYALILRQPFVLVATSIRSERSGG